MQRTLQRRKVLAARCWRRVPRLHGRLRGFEQLAGLFTKNRRHFRVKIDGWRRRAHRHRGRERRRSRRRLLQALQRRQRMNTGAFALLSRCANALIERSIGTRDAHPQRIVPGKIAAALVEVAGDRFHRRHTIGEQQQVGIVETDTTIERLSQPVIERLGEPDSVPCLGHLGTSRQRVAGSIDFFGQDVWRRMGPFARQPTTHRGDVTGGFTRINLA